MPLCVATSTQPLNHIWLGVVAVVCIDSPDMPTLFTGGWSGELATTDSHVYQAIRSELAGLVCFRHSVEKVPCFGSGD
jgi:hypothetical protein